IKTTLRKNMGKKNCELSKENQKQILDIYLNFINSEYSKILSNEEFGYYEVTIERPLRQSVKVNSDTLSEFKKILEDLGILQGKLDTKVLKEYKEKGVKSTKGSKIELSDSKNMKTYLEIFSS